MARKILLEKRKGSLISKAIEIFESPQQISPLTSPLAWKILCELSKEPSYPKQLAKRLHADEQIVYYHINALRECGLIEVVNEERKQGAVCRFFAPTCKAFGIEIPSEEEITGIERGPIYEKLKEFFYEFIKDGIFDGSIVVGSPLPHGPFLTAARDGHYAIQLAMALGSLCELPKKFIVKLDTEVKAEHEEKRNMALIGGPITNIVAGDINERLKIRFRWAEGWRVFSEGSGREYADEDLGVIAKIKNPWDHRKAVILLAGLKFEGTKSCILAITQQPDKILRGYERLKDFFCLLRGLDRDGDGKVDDVEIVENIKQP